MDLPSNKLSTLCLKKYCSNHGMFGITIFDNRTECNKLTGSILQRYMGNRLNILFNNIIIMLPHNLYKNMLSFVKAEVEKQQIYNVVYTTYSATCPKNHLTPKILAKILTDLVDRHKDKCNPYLLLPIISTDDLKYVLNILLEYSLDKLPVCFKEGQSLYYIPGIYRNRKSLWVTDDKYFWEKRTMSGALQPTIKKYVLPYIIATVPPMKNHFHDINIYQLNHR